MKIRTILCLSTAVASMAVSCTKRTVQPRTGELLIDTLVAGAANECTVACQFVTILNPDDSPALAAIEQADIAYFFERDAFDGTARAAADSLLREIRDAYLSDLSGQRTYQYNAESELTVHDSLVTFVIDRSSYMGGAHGMYGTECHTYSLADGYEYLLSDLFDARQRERLNEALRIRIREAYEAADDEALTDAGFFPEYIAATENFIITPEGMTFIYNPYEIGCYALGPVEVTLRQEEIDRIREE